jgi:hypothetical protein
VNTVQQHPGDQDTDGVGKRHQNTDGHRVAGPAGPPGQVRGQDRLAVPGQGRVPGTQRQREKHSEHHDQRGQPVTDQPAQHTLSGAKQPGAGGCGRCARTSRGRPGAGRDLQRRGAHVEGSARVRSSSLTLPSGSGESTRCTPSCTPSPMAVSSCHPARSNRYRLSTRTVRGRSSAAGAVNPQVSRAAGRVTSGATYS